jgi:hypothetical protein
VSSPDRNAEQIARDEHHYTRALRRIDQLTLGLGVVGVVASLIAKGPNGTAAFLAGAAIAWLNFRGIKKVVEGLGSEGGEKGGAFQAVVLGMRYVFMALGVFAIIKFLNVTLWSVLPGLLVPVGGVLIEIILELVTFKADGRSSSTAPPRNLDR